MTHQIYIWSHTKGKNNPRIETKIELNEEDLEELALKKYKKLYRLDETKEYNSTLEETTI